MEDNQGKKNIITQVTSPLALLTLMVLVAEGLLFFLAKKAIGIDFTVIVVGMIIVIPLVLLVLFLKPEMFKSHSNDPQKPSPKYDVFISTPMAAWGNAEKYEAQRNEIINIRNALKSECKFKRIFYAGDEIDSMDNFEAKDISAKEDIDAIKVSKYFLLIYPESLPSGALVEAGTAIAEGISCLFFVPDRKTLPFMLEQADQAFDNIKIYEVTGSDQIIGYLEQHGNSIFP